MNLFKKGIKAFSWTFLGSGIGFIFQLIIAKLLGASEYGKANVILGFIGTYYSFLSLGLPTLLIRESGKNIKNADEIYSEFVRIYIILDIIIFPIIYFTFNKTLVYNKFNVVIILLLVMLSQIENLTYSYFIGIKKQDTASFIRDTLIRLSRVGSFFIFFLIFSNYFSYVLAYFFSLLIPPFIVLKRYTNKKILSFKWIIKNSWKFYMITITYSLYGNLSKIMQKMFSTNEAVGYLSIGMTLGTIGAMLGTALANVTMPEFAHAWKEKDMEKIDIIFKDVSRWNTYIMLPIISFIIIHINRILGFLGEDYSKGTLIVSMIILSQFINSFVGPNGTLLNMSGYEWLEIINGFAMIATGLLFGIILGSKYSWGVAFSIAASIVVVNILKFIQVRMIHKIYPYKFKTLLYILLFVFLSIIIFIITKNISNHYLWFLINLFFVIIMVFFAFYFSPITQDREIIDKFFNKIGVKR
ncbi:lipopolysaccharide biosynthesis protein [Marinitoga litoralis]|uniref:lipopolysaccharide biosynthesis protein n=1 Tax=Marinitoga litoralis TaxID=570855 RepID=UPI001962260F|nr:oligosaccharide flippase family protein [Marinitoga litoralis]MBM7560128.1 O-antigen/teichoic acid export membrane protein [Marinitoga litoralis]